MKSHRIVLSILTISLVFILILSAGCDTLGIGSSGGGAGDGGAEEGDGALDQIDLSDSNEGADDGDSDQTDPFSSCPDNPDEYTLTLDYMLEYREANGYIREQTDTSAGVTIVVEGEDAYMLFRDAQAETIPGTIEGHIGDCEVEGMFELSFLVIGVCENGVAILDITGTYEIYHRRITCPGQVAEDFTDSLVDGPSGLFEFQLSQIGFTIPMSLDLGVAKMEYTWSLAPSLPR